MFINPLARTLAIVGLLAAAPLAAADSKTIFEDDFAGYEGVRPLGGVWQRADITAPNSSSPELIKTFTPRQDIGPLVEPEHAPMLRLSNGVVFVELPQSIDEDFTLSYRMLISQYARSGIVALLNAEGTQGYGVRWNAANEHQHLGNGMVLFCKFNLDAPWDNWDTTGEILGSGVGSGHPVTGYELTSISPPAFSDQWRGFAHVTLTWKKDTGELALAVNDKNVLRTTDKDFSTFGRLYLRGNTSVYLDDVKLTTGTPE